MSDVDNAGSVAEQGVAATQAPLTAGRMMRNAREAAGLHVAALAVSMKIPVKKLEALEADRLDLLHDAVFVRALASSVCRTLKIDPAQVLDKLPMNMAPRLNPDERGINAPFRSSGETAGVSIAAFLTRPAVMIVIALLVGVAGVAFFPDIKVSESSVGVVAPANKPEVLPEQSLVTKAPPVEMVEAPVVPQSVASEAQSLPAPQAVSSSPAPVVASGVVRSASAPATPTTGLVVFKARAASWVKVVDAKGVVQLSKTLGAGEVAGASGQTPLSVVVGRVDMTDVEVRGNAFSLAAVAKENVARFEVK